jgi:hypothetical protein
MKMEWFFIAIYLNFNSMEVPIDGDAIMKSVIIPLDGGDGTIKFGKSWGVSYPVEYRRASHGGPMAKANLGRLVHLLNTKRLLAKNANTSVAIYVGSKRSLRKATSSP